MSRRDRAQEAPMSFFSFQDIVACTTGIMVIITILLALELVTRAEGRPGQPPTGPDVEGLQREIVDLTRQRDELLRLQREKKIIVEQLEARTVITPEQLKALADKVIALEGRIREVTIEVQRLQMQRDELDRGVRKAEEDKKKDKKKIRVTTLEGKPARDVQLFLECSANEGVVARVPADCVPEKLKQFSGPDWPEEFLLWVRQTCDPAKEQFVLLVRPDAVDNKHCSRIRTALGTSGYGPQNKPFIVGCDIWPPERSLFKQP